MKAITLWQPWASLIADGIKKIETRPRPWKYKGPVAIHAGLHVDREACIRFGYNPDEIPRGVILCVVEKTGCVQFSNPLAPPDVYGDFAPGRYGYPIADTICEFLPPIAAKGSQGIWEWEPPPQFHWQVNP